MDSTKPVLLVVSSTYPRWPNDHEPGFVHELSRRMTSDFEVVALVPSSPGAARSEVLDGVEIRRFRYAPRRLETLVNDGGIMTNLRKYRWKWLLVPSFLVAQLGAARKIILRREPRAIHAHWMLPQGVIVSVLRTMTRRTPAFVVTSHGADLFALRGRLFERLRAWTLRRASAVTVVSGAMRDTLRREGVGTVIEVEPMGTDLADRFTPDRTTERSRDEILFVGRLVEKKGLRYLIEALSTVRRRHPSAHLTVAGFGPELEATRTLADRLGIGEAVTFLGAVPQSDLPRLYRRVAVFAAPFVEAVSGDQEGFGLVLVEALGCGCPVITTDLPATREVASRAGSVLIVPQADSEALATALDRVLSDPGRITLQAAADRTALLERFDWSSVARRYAGILAGVS